jgi:hypothetical protein
MSTIGVDHADIDMAAMTARMLGDQETEPPCQA